jgi:formate hydrogenlyase subunit 3/multisubunit Na+/H+ antiporter MnhD subunit
VGGFSVVAVILFLGRLNGGVFSIDQLSPSTLRNPQILVLIIGVACAGALCPFNSSTKLLREVPFEISAVLSAALLPASAIFLASRPLVWSEGAIAPQWGQTLQLVGGVSAFVSMLLALRQNTMRMVAIYAVTAQTGVAVVAIGSGEEMGLVAALLVLASLVLSGTAYLLLVSLHTEHRPPKDCEPTVPYRFQTASELLAFGSLVGLPFLSGFVGFWMTCHALAVRGELHYTVALVVSAMLGVASTVKVSVIRPVPPDSSMQSKPGVNLAQVPGLVCLSAALLLGLAPSLILTSLSGRGFNWGTGRELGQVSWSYLGVLGLSGTWPSTVLLAGIGVVTLVLVAVARQKQQPTLAPSSQAGIFDHTIASQSHIVAREEFFLIFNQLFDKFSSVLDGEAVVLASKHLVCRIALWLNIGFDLLEERYFLPGLVLVCLAVGMIMTR